jgi:predicted membrane protein
MNKQQMFSTGVVGLLCLVIILTYNSYNLFKESLVIWAMLLVGEIFILVIYTVDWLIKEIDGK